MAFMGIATPEFRCPFFMDNLTSSYKMGNTMPVSVNKRLLGSKEAAEYLSLSRTLLYQLVESNKIQSLKINSRRLFDVNELDEFVEKLKTEQRHKEC